MTTHETLRVPEAMNINLHTRINECIAEPTCENVKLEWFDIQIEECEPVLKTQALGFVFILK